MWGSTDCKQTIVAWQEKWKKENIWIECKIHPQEHQLFGIYLPPFMHQSKQYLVVLTQSLLLHPTKKPMVSICMLCMLLVCNRHSNPSKRLQWWTHHDSKGSIEQESSPVPPSWGILPCLKCKNLTDDNCISKGNFLTNIVELVVPARGRCWEIEIWAYHQSLGACPPPWHPACPSQHPAPAFLMRSSPANYRLPLRQQL
jgi:hypothetical protein